MAWQEWEDCSKVCGNGTRTRRRECKNPMYGGKECDEIADNDHQKESCNLPPCKGNKLPTKTIKYLIPSLLYGLI